MLRINLKALFDLDNSSYSTSQWTHSHTLSWFSLVISQTDNPGKMNDKLGHVYQGN